MSTWLTHSGKTGFTNLANTAGQCYTISEAEWSGNTGNSYRDATSDLKLLNEAAADFAKAAGDEISKYGDAVVEQRDLMLQARLIAYDAGLQVSDDVIYEPDPVPDLPPNPALNGGTVTAAQIQAYNQQVDLADLLTARANAFDDALELAKQAWDIGSEAVIALVSWLKDAPQSIIFDIAAGFMGGMYKTWLEPFKKTAGSLEKRLGRAYAGIAKYALEGKPKLGNVYSNFAKTTEREIAENIASKAGYVKGLGWGGRAMRAVPILGWGLVAAGAGMDIADGESVGRVAVENAAGIGAGMGAGFLATVGVGLFAVAVGATAPAWVPVAAAAVAGATFGFLATEGAGWAYDKLAEPVGDAAKAVWEGAKDVGNAISEGISDIWDSIF